MPIETESASVSTKFTLGEYVSTKAAFASAFEAFATNTPAPAPCIKLCEKPNVNEIENRAKRNIFFIIMVETVNKLKQIV